MIFPPKKCNKEIENAIKTKQGHETEQYNELKKAFENAIKKEELKEFMDTASAKRASSNDNRKKSWPDGKRGTKSDVSSSKMKVINVIQDVGLLASRKRLREAHGDDPLVDTITIDQCVVKRILVDSGSSVNVLFKDSFNQMDIPRSKVLPYAVLLVGVTGQTVKTDSKITILVSIGDAAHMVEFLIVSTPSPYNCIMGHPTLN